MLTYVMLTYVMPAQNTCLWLSLLVATQLATIQNFSALLTLQRQAQQQRQSYNPRHTSSGNHLRRSELTGSSNLTKQLQLSRSRRLAILQYQYGTCRYPCKALCAGFPAVDCPNCSQASLCGCAIARSEDTATFLWGTFPAKETGVRGNLGKLCAGQPAVKAWFAP